MSDDPTDSDESDAPRCVSLDVGGREYVVLSTPLARPDAMAGLTEAERDIAEAIVEGLSDGEIAERRGVSLNTVRNQVTTIFEKLGVESRYELVARLAGAPDDRSNPSNAK